MKNRKLIAGLATVGVLAVGVAAFFGLKGNKEVGILLPLDTNTRFP